MARIGYARVSTADQRLDRQLDELAAEGCERVFSEKISGAAKHLPERDAMLGYLRPGDVVTVIELSRLGRSTADLLGLVEQLDAKEAHLRVLGGKLAGVDTSTPAGRLVFTIFSAGAEFERENLREPVVSGLEAARARGQHLGRKPALTAEQVDQAALLVEGGQSKRSVARSFGVAWSTLQRHLRIREARAEL